MVISEVYFDLNSCSIVQMFNTEIIWMDIWMTVAEDPIAEGFNISR